MEATHLISPFTNKKIRPTVNEHNTIFFSQSAMQEFLLRIDNIFSIVVGII
jgi:hypothetical protein